MIIAFQVVLLFFIFASFAEISSKSEKSYRNSVVIFCISAMVIFLVSTQL
jgi:predicted membrane channel-forming protein YqfA (hemolysin III family)